MPIAVAIVTGIHTSKTTPPRVPWNPRGATPMMVNSCRFRRMVLPSTFRVAAKPGLPHAVADHGDRRAAFLVASLFGQKRAAQHGLDLQQIEVVCRDQFRPGALRSSVGADAQRREASEGDSGDQLQIVAVVAVVEIGRVDQVLPGGGHGLNEGEFVRIADAREGVQQDGIDPTEHRRVYRNAQAEREDGDGREPGAAAQESAIRTGRPS